MGRMRHEDRIAAMRKEHIELEQKLGRHDPSRLPATVDRKALEEAYDRMQEYVLVFKKREK